MRDIYLTVVSELSGGWRYRWRAVIAAWIVAIAGWGYVLSMPNRYEANARVFVDTESVLTPLLQGLAVQTDVMTKVNMISRALISRPQLEKVVQETGLYLRAGNDAELDGLIRSLELAISIRPTQTNLYSISYQDSDRVMAQRVVQTFLDALVEDTLGVNRTDSGRAQAFLQQQIDEYEQRLVEAEAALAEFKKRNVGMMPDAGGNYFERLQAATNEENRLSAAVAVVVERRDELARQLEGEEPVFGLTSAGPGATATDAAIANLEEELQRKRLRFTDAHPEVRAILGTIEQLQERAAIERQALRSSPETLGLDANPVYQNLQIAFNEAQVQVTTLNGQLREQRMRVAELKQLLDTIPEVEAELVRLNRDYEVTKSQYDTFVRRLESARISEEAEESNDEIKFRVIDPAIASLDPVAPQRAILLTGVLIVALAVGGGLAFVLHQLHPVFSSSKALRDFAGLPVLGTVSTWGDPVSAGRTRRADLACFGALAALVAVFLVTLAAQDAGVELMARIMNGSVA
jgi:polysaccharide chain length determinant protein (PEP-CTERM system associated)